MVGEDPLALPLSVSYNSAYQLRRVSIVQYYNEKEGWGLT